jgi:NAD(P)H-dependent flavin oxidoreductase YrpB (nitropropane dioxygenase family)
MQENGRKLASKVSSRVEELLGIVYPIIQAPFGGFASQRLAATVSNLGGLGSLGVVSLSESAIRDAVVEMLSLTNKPFAVNLWVSTSDAGSSRLDDSVGRTKRRSMSPRGCRRVNDGADCGVRRHQEIGVRGAWETVRNCRSLGWHQPPLST